MPSFGSGSHYQFHFSTEPEYQFPLKMQFSLWRDSNWGRNAVAQPHVPQAKPSFSITSKSEQGSRHPTFWNRTFPLKCSPRVSFLVYLGKKGGGVRPSKEWNGTKRWDNVFLSRFLQLLFFLKVPLNLDGDLPMLKVNLKTRSARSSSNRFRDEETSTATQVPDKNIVFF